MSADVSRTLAAFIARMGLGRAAARKLLDRYGSARSVADLPVWITEAG